MTVAIIVGAGWYLVDRQPGMDWRTFAEPDSPETSPETSQVASAQTVPSEPAGANHSEIPVGVPSSEAKTASVTEEAPAENPEVADAGGDSQMESVSGEASGVADELVTDAVPPAATESEAEIVVVASTTAIDEVEGSEPTVAKAAELDEQQTDPSDGETAPVISAEVEAEGIPDAGVTSSTSLAGPGSDRFQRDIRTSLEWIDGRANDVGTLQIMLLSHQPFDESTYYDYIDGLARQGVDTSQIRILHTLTVNKKVFSVVYGEYQNPGRSQSCQGRSAEYSAEGITDTAQCWRSKRGNAGTQGPELSIFAVFEGERL